MRSTVRCFGDVKDTIDSKQLKNQIYLLRFGHTRALLFKKKGHEMAISPVLGKLTHMCGDLFCLKVLANVEFYLCLWVRIHK